VARRGKKLRKAHTVSNAKKTGSATTVESQTLASAREDRSGRVPNWAKFVIGAFVTAIVGILAANLYPVIKRIIFASPPPITFSINQVVGPGWGITVSDQQRLQSRLNSISSCDSLHRAAVAAGGADDYGTSLHLLVQGSSRSGVTITGMHVRIVNRSAPLNGAYVFCQSAGSESAMPINFNLNDRIPSALGPPGKPSFFGNGSVVHLNNGEVYPLNVAATVSGSAVKWVIDASVLVNGQSTTVTISDNGKPFETTAALPLGQYGDLYEYAWGSQERLLHFRSHARTPTDCAADVALQALRRQGLRVSSQVLSVDCAGDMAHVEVWVPSERCFVHYLGFHRQAHSTFFASHTVCPASIKLGALFSRATIRHAGGNPQSFANAFGPYIVSSGSIPANPGPYDHVPRLSIDDLATRAGCTIVQSFPSFSTSTGASQVATCRTQGVSLLMFTFPDSASRNRFYGRASDSRQSQEGRAVGNQQLLVVGPTWLIYGTQLSKGAVSYVAGRTEQQFAQQVGGEAGQYTFYGADTMIGNEVPTIANDLL
jgi:hypothetical protein